MSEVISRQQTVFHVGWPLQEEYWRNGLRNVYKASVDEALAEAVAGDVVYVANSHREFWSKPVRWDSFGVSLWGEGATCRS